MKILTKKTTAIWIICLVLVISIISIIAFTSISKTTAYKTTPEEYFNSRNVNQLIEIIKTQYDGYENIDITCAAALIEKIDEGDLNRIKKEIFDPEGPDSIKILLLDICANKKFVLDHEAVTELMFDKTQSRELRSRAFDYCVEFGEDYKEEIKTIATGDDEDLIYWAIRDYYSLWREEGLELSINILKNPSDEFNDQLQASLENCSTALKLDYSKDNCFKFINFCEKLLTGKGMARDETASDSIIYTIEYIDSIDSLNYLIKSEYLTDDEKMGLVYRSSELLKKTAQEPANDENISLITECLSFCDLPEITEILQTNIKENEEYYSKNPEKLKNIRDVIQKSSKEEALTNESIE